MTPGDDTDGQGADESSAVWVDLPSGFQVLALAEAQERLDRAAARLDATGAERERAAIAELGRHFEQLRAENTVYFGRGRHLAEDGRTVESTLVIAVQERGERRGRSMVFADVIRERARRQDTGKVDRVELGDKSALVIESTRSVVPAGVAVSAEAGVPVFQIDAVVPSELGDRIVTIGLSTGDLAAGPEFRPMVEALAASVSFQPPLVGDPFAVLRG